ncbi:MAG: hypothetical protein UZ14_CFX002001499 [Chloroflexi bacterium OLB14]|nr:MAG: hypothetical protein UZ14_CFX002001499 [Chloroflexi bacterium OLB14]
MSGNRSQLALGVILVLIGVWFLLDQTVPAFSNFFDKYTEWPINLLLIGAVIFVVGLVLGSPGLSVPAAIVAGTGAIFYYQKVSGIGDDSWAYMWTLYPGFVGIGSVLAGLLGDNTAHNLKRGLNMMVFSAVLFLIFSAFLGGWDLLGSYGPAILLILLGLWVLGSGLYRTFKKKNQSE